MAVKISMDSPAENAGENAAQVGTEHRLVRLNFGGEPAGLFGLG